MYSGLIYTVGNRVPVHAFFGEANGFVVHRPCFERGVVQQSLVVTLDVELEVQRLDESLWASHLIRTSIRVPIS